MNCEYCGRSLDTERRFCNRSHAAMNWTKKKRQAHKEPPKIEVSLTLPKRYINPIPYPERKRNMIMQYGTTEAKARLEKEMQHDH